MDDTARNWASAFASRVGEQIAEARSAAGMTAVELAASTERLGVPIHRVAVSRIEKGTQVPSITELVALGMALDGDWLGWLVRAANESPIQVRRRDNVAYYKRLLAEVDEELETVQHNLFQAEKAPIHFDMSIELQKKITADAERYRATIDSLRERREMILVELGSNA